MTKILELINGFVWGVPALLLIVGVGLYFSIRTRWVQLRLFPHGCRLFLRQFRRTPEADGISGFRALCTALAATVGTGNLAGVAGAIAIGGPGAIFWMWICGILGMVTKFAEATLAVRYRCRDGQGRWVGGPMYMIRRGLGSRYGYLAKVYCFFGIVAALGVGNATQVNAVVTGVTGAVAALGGRVSPAIPWITGLILGALGVLMLRGGAKRIGAAAELLVPFAACAYVLLSLGVIICCRRSVPAAFTAILRGAFSPAAVTGGTLGSAFAALRVGASRGVFTNEAGMGTASIAHASAEVEHPVQQGLMGVMEVFLDTIVICTVTALVILCSGVPVPYGTDAGAALTAEAFSCVYGSWANLLIAVFLCCFAVATLLGWGLYGLRCAQFLFGEEAGKSFALLQGAAVMAGAFLKTDTVWLLSETVNGLMAITNLIALARLSPELLRLTKEYNVMRTARAVHGGTYANIDQCQPLRAVPYAEIPSPCGSGKGPGEDDLPSEYRSAGPAHTGGLL